MSGTRCIRAESNLNMTESAPPTSSQQTTVERLLSNVLVVVASFPRETSGHDHKFRGRIRQFEHVEYLAAPSEKGTTRVKSAELNFSGANRLT